MIAYLKHILCIAMLSAAIPMNAQQSPSFGGGRGGYFTFGTNINPKGERIEVDSHGIIINGKHTIPVMGEIHYARVPKQDWRREIRKMRAGGITILSTYCFWIHHEPQEGRWDWSGNKDLHQFLQVCKEENMPVVLRIGPFCHGEVYQGGFPEWIVEKAQKDPSQFKIRSLAPGFIAATQRLYSNIYAQASDMLWKHGGPIIGVQIENECRGPWSYYMKLKDMAVSIGFDTPFYTRTGWPKLNGKEEFGKLLPLYGDYADGFWDRVLADMPGDYPKAFIMKDTRVSAVIATETFGTNQDTKMEAKDLQYPYLTCELGGGMMPAYHRRINISGKEATPLAICKLGSGSNLPGYYMYHGGTNPYDSYIDKNGVEQPKTMAETQTSPVTNYNDMPYMSYDFQSPLGEMGQLNTTAFHETRILHQFLADWGEMLSTMKVDTLSDHYARRGCFEFYNDYVRILNENGICYVRPVNMPFQNHLVTADAQPFCKIGNTLYFIPIKGKKPVIIVDGKKYACKLDRIVKAKDINLCVMSESRAKTAFKIDEKLYFAQNDGVLYKDEQGNVVEEYWDTTDLAHALVNADNEANALVPLRNVVMGAQKVAAMPTNEEFSHAAIYNIDLQESQNHTLISKGDKTVSDLKKQYGDEIDNHFLRIRYKGDVARVYADGKLVADNFWNGKPMYVRLSDVVGKKIELRILPLGKDYPIYFQKEQRKVVDSAPDGKLLELDGIDIICRTTNSLDLSLGSHY